MTPFNPYTAQRKWLIGRLTLTRIPLFFRFFRFNITLTLLNTLLQGVGKKVELTPEPVGLLMSHTSIYWHVVQLNIGSFFANQVNEQVLVFRVPVLVDLYVTTLVKLIIS